MRFASTATTLIAAVAAPFAPQVFGPSMSPAEFVSAVRCTALGERAYPDADWGAARHRLNLEARRQPVEAAAAARAEVSAARVMGFANVREQGMVVSSCDGFAVVAGEAAAGV